MTDTAANTDIASDQAHQNMLFYRALELIEVKPAWPPLDPLNMGALMIAEHGDKLLTGDHDDHDTQAMFQFFFVCWERGNTWPDLEPGPFAAEMRIKKRQMLN